MSQNREQDGQIPVPTPLLFEYVQPESCPHGQQLYCRDCTVETGKHPHETRGEIVTPSAGALRVAEIHAPNRGNRLSVLALASLIDAESGLAEAREALRGLLVDAEELHSQLDNRLSPEPPFFAIARAALARIEGTLEGHE